MRYEPVLYSDDDDRDDDLTDLSASEDETMYSEPWPQVSIIWKPYVHGSALYWSVAVASSQGN